MSSNDVLNPTVAVQGIAPSVHHGYGGNAPLLICEGACNPHIAAIDEKLKGRGIRSDGTKCKRDWDLPPDLYASCRYTVHTLVVNGELFKCTHCGHVRRFGGNTQTHGVSLTSFWKPGQQ